MSFLPYSPHSRPLQRPPTHSTLLYKLALTPWHHQMFHLFITAHKIKFRCSRRNILRRRHLVNSSWAPGSVARSIPRLCCVWWLSACKYLSQNWLQGLPRRDLRHQIFYNEGSPATFSMFYTNLKMGSISHETSWALSSALWCVQVIILSCCQASRPCPCSDSLHVWH